MGCAAIQPGTQHTPGDFELRARGFDIVTEIFASTYEGLKQLGLNDAELTLLDTHGNVLLDYDPAGNNIVAYDANQKLINLVDLGVPAAKELVDTWQQARLSSRSAASYLQ